MAGKKDFVNPLTRSSESELNVPDLGVGSDVATTEGVAAASRPRRTKGRGKVFEETHQRFAGWVSKELKHKFDELAAEKEVSKAELLDEAIVLLLHKQERKPYTRRGKAD